MEESVGMSNFRENLRDQMDSVQQGHTYLVERFGKPTAAVIPVELYNQLKQARSQFRETVQAMREQAKLSEQEAMELSLEVQGEVRADQTS